jgi:8-oxo-dGTP pyrophosphatase MutT (NUDIX family)
LTAPIRIVEVAELDFGLDPTPWSFAEAHAADVAAYWAKLRLTKPAAFNGRVLLMRAHELAPGAKGSLKLKGAFFETGYAEFLTWRAMGHPGERVENCFSMVALRSADGAFLLGEMAPHTVNSGQIYFPAGTPDPSDVFDGKVDLEASARRELQEETGLAPDEAAGSCGWTVVFALPRIACMKLMTLAVPADEAKAKIDAYLALDPREEFSRMHIVRDSRDIDENRTPAFVAAYLRAALAKADENAF